MTQQETMPKPADPKCGSQNVKFLKSWEIKPKEKYSEERAITHVLEVSLWLCMDCGHKFRTYKKIEA